MQNSRFCSDICCHNMTTHPFPAPTFARLSIALFLVWSGLATLGGETVTIDRAEYEALLAELKALRGEQARMQQTLEDGGEPAMEPRSPAGAKSFPEPVVSDQPSPDRSTSWRLEAGANYEDASVISLGSQARIEVEIPVGLDDWISLSLRGAYGKKDDTVTTQNLRFNGQYRHVITPRLYLFELATFTHNKIDGIRYRALGGIGLGYKWVTTERWSLTTELGPNVIAEELDGLPADLYAAARAGVRAEWRFSSWAKLFTDVEWVGRFEDPGRYYLNTGTGLQTAITDSLSLVFRMDTYYTSDPSPVSDENSLSLTSSLAWEL